MYGGRRPCHRHIPKTPCRRPPRTRAAPPLERETSSGPDPSRRRWRGPLRRACRHTRSRPPPPAGRRSSSLRPGTGGTTCVQTAAGFPPPLPRCAPRRAPAWAKWRYPVRRPGSSRTKPSECSRCRSVEGRRSQKKATPGLHFLRSSFFCPHFSVSPFLRLSYFTPLRPQSSLSGRWRQSSQLAEIEHRIPHHPSTFASHQPQASGWES